MPAEQAMPRVAALVAEAQAAHRVVALVAEALVVRARGVPAVRMRSSSVSASLPGVALNVK